MRSIEELNEKLALDDYYRLQDIMLMSPEEYEKYEAKQERKKHRRNLMFGMILVVSLIGALILGIYGLYNTKANTYTYEMELNERYTQKTGTSNSFHHFKFTIEEAGIVTPYFDVGESIFSDPDGYIVSTDNTEEFIFCSRMSGTNDDYIYLEPGMYEFIVGASSVFDRPKEFTVGLDYSRVKTKKEQENNDLFNKAEKISDNEFYKCRLSSEEDVDVFKVDINDGEQLFVDLSSNAVLGTFTGDIGWFSADGRRELTSQNYFKIEVYSKENFETPIYEKECIGLSEEQIPVAENGTYYIKVSAADKYYNGNYVICRKAIQ